jgi:acyl-coenzyme A thioesterase PaaI-like protein
MTQRPIQDFYPEEVAICYGCGRNNPRELHLRTHWDGVEGIARFTPEPYHTGFPGVVYGGLIANLIDCHCVGTAIAAAYDAEGRAPGTEPAIAYVTGNLNVRYIAPTPIGHELILRSRVKALHEKKAVITCSLHANGIECASAELIAVRVKSWAKGGGR